MFSRRFWELEKKFFLTPDLVLFMFKPRKVGSVTHKCGMGLGLSGLAQRAAEQGVEGHPSGGPAASRVWQRLWLQGLQDHRMQWESPASFGISASARARGPPVGSGGIWGRWVLYPSLACWAVLVPGTPFSSPWPLSCPFQPPF